MRKLSNEQKDQFIELIRRKIGLSESARFIELRELFSSNIHFEPDILIMDGNNLYIVELARNLTFEKIATSKVLKDLIRGFSPNYQIYTIIIARSILPSMEQLANDQGIILIEALSDNSIESIDSRNYTQKTKLTAEKTWKIVSLLLKEKISSIRHLSEKANVSYGLAHLTVNMLIEKRIAERKVGFIEIVDTKKLLNAIAWERSFENLKIGEFKAQFSNSHEAAREISGMLHRQGKPFAFTGYTAGSLYTGYSVRHDAVYLYINKKNYDSLCGQLSTNDSEGIKVQVYAPDRDVFNNTREIESILVVSPGQALLDMAGLGYKGMDITKAMLDKYEGLL